MSFVSFLPTPYRSLWLGLFCAKSYLLRVYARRFMLCVSCYSCHGVFCIRQLLLRPSNVLLSSCCCMLVPAFINVLFALYIPGLYFNYRCNLPLLLIASRPCH